MSTPKEKAKELVDKYSLLVPVEFGGMDKNLAKECAIIAVENEYHEKRELIFLLRTNKAINEKVYLHFIQHLIDEEKEVKQEIEKL